MGEKQDEQAAAEALAQLLARLWYAFQCERLYQRSNQWTREYQSILLSLDVAHHLRAKAINIFSAGLAIAAGVSMAAGALVARAVIRGTGPLARLMFLSPAAQQAAVAAEVAQATAAAELVTARMASYQAATAAGRMLLVPPRWIVSQLEVMPRVLVQRLWQEKVMRITLAVFSVVPMAVATSYVGSVTGTDARPHGSLGTLKHLLTREDPNLEFKLSLERAEQIIAGLLEGLDDNQKSLLTMTDDELLGVMVRLDIQVMEKLRGDPKLRQEKLDDEMTLFLRAQILMDYWLGVQTWADPLRPRASRELQAFAQQVR